MPTRDQRADPALEWWSKPSAEHHEATDSTAVSRWLDEDPRQGHWNAVAILVGLIAGNGVLKSKI